MSTKQRLAAIAGITLLSLAGFLGFACDDDDDGDGIGQDIEEGLEDIGDEAEDIGDIIEGDTPVPGEE